MTGPPEVRPASPRDAITLARCHVACWREAYVGIVPADTLAARTGDLDARILRWEDILRTGPRRTWLAAAGDQALGFACAGAGRDDDLQHLPELYALYVRASEHGSGLADRLVGPAIGLAPAYLWVAGENPRALRYYQKIGFRLDGRSKIDRFLGGIREVRMTRTHGSPVQR